MRRYNEYRTRLSLETWERLQNIDFHNNGRENKV